MLQLAIQSQLPLVHVTTDDLVNIGDLLNHIAEGTVPQIALPLVIDNINNLKVPASNILYTLDDCKSLRKLYMWCVASGKTIIFVNTPKDVLHFDAGSVTPPLETVLGLLEPITDNPEQFIQVLGGLSLKDIGEIIKLTITRDDELTVVGINTTRRSYRNLKGITPINTDCAFYQAPNYLENWVANNKKFFIDPIHANLIPRGLLFDGTQGTGKTAGSKYLAREFGVPLYHLDVGALKGKFVGESESNFLAALQQADIVEPCILLIDEIEKVFTNTSDSGVTSSLLSQLLWWLQEHKSRVLTIMTTNSTRDIPQELYREGRIDVVMNFSGIESKAEGVEFISSVIDSMRDDLVGSGVTIPPAKTIKASLTTVLSGIYADNTAVPQAKLVQVAYDLIKSMV